MRSISSWMPRNKRSASAKSGPRRSRNTLLTRLAAGRRRSAVVRRFMGIIIRSHWPSSAMFCRRSPLGQRQEQVAGQQIVGCHALAHRRFSQAGGGFAVEDVSERCRVVRRQGRVVGARPMRNHGNRFAHQELPGAEKAHGLLRRHAKQLSQGQAEASRDRPIWPGSSRASRARLGTAPKATA